MASRFHINGKLLRVIIDLFTDTTGYAIINDVTTERFPIYSGVLQGSVLGPTLFLLFLDDLLDELHESKLGISMGRFALSVLAYADDVTLLSIDQGNLQRLLDICCSWSIKNGMTFGFDKCFAVVFNSRSKKLDDLLRSVFVELIYALIIYLHSIQKMHLSSTWVSILQTVLREPNLNALKWYLIILSLITDESLTLHT